MKGYADHWRNISDISDEKVAEIIRNDKIDICVDLAGHTAYNRILVFARKPAPLQVTWIGYPNTTGLSAMDYRIVDNFTDPVGTTEQFHTETLIRLPHSFLCYFPNYETPKVKSLPALENGHITFGSFNVLQKISSEVIQLWSEILKKIPDSRLLIKAKGLSNNTTRKYVLSRFLQHGIPEGRLNLLSFTPTFKEHIEIYNRVDIILDTFPYNGTTNTCEALWMGLPVITLEGKTHVSRVGVSLLTNVGLPEYIAKTQDKYIEKAVELAKDIEKLQMLRKSLRDKMIKSPLTNAKQFTAHLEDCYRKMWKTWCLSL
jgi:protein O-GlcNAc transferase